MSHNLLSPPSNPGIRPVPVKPPSRDVLCVLIIDGTESMAEHFKNLYQSFVNPFLSQLRLPVPVEVDGQKTKITPLLKIGVVIYGDYLPRSTIPLRSHYFTSDFQVLQDNLATVKFEKGGPCYSAVGEGLCAALEMFDLYQENAKTMQVVDPIRHCVLIGNSLPYSSFTSLNLKEEYDNLPISSICSKLKEYQVNFSIMSTNKLLEPLYLIPDMINAEDTCILDYVRAGLSHYIARMAGVLPSESFKGPGWLMITNFKDKRKIRDFDPVVLAELKKAKVEPPHTAPLPKETAPETGMLTGKEISTPINQGTTPSVAEIPLKGEELNTSNGATFSAPNTVQASPASQPVEFQDISSPNKRKYNKVQDTSTIESPKSMEGATMQRQTSNKSAKGGTKKQTGPKKLTKAQLKAQVKASAASNLNSLDSAVPGQLTGLDSNPVPTTQPSQLESMDVSRGTSEQPTPIFASKELNKQQLNMSALHSPPNVKSPATPVTNMMLNPEPMWASPSQTSQMNNFPNRTNFTPAGMFQSPNLRPGAMVQPNLSSLAVPSPGHMSNSPNKDPSPGMSGLNPNRSQQTPTSTPNIEASKMMVQGQNMPNAPLFSADTRIWAGEITFRLTNVNINEDAIGAVTVQPMNQPGSTVEDFMLDKWPQRLQISSFLPCNVTALMEYSRSVKAPAFILHPAPDGDSPKNVKVYSAVLTKLPEKQGVLVVDFNIGESNTHGIYLFKAQQHVLGFAFLKSPFPNPEQFAMQPDTNHNLGMMRPQLTPQQIAAFKQQQTLSGAMMNQGIPMNMNPMAMGMFGMNMMNPNMFMANPGMMNPNLTGMYNLDALRRAQASAPQFMSSVPAMQQLQQMQAQGIQLHPQQIQQLQQMQRQQMARPQNHPQ